MIPFKLYFRQMPVPLALLNEKGEILEANRSFLRLVDHSMGSLRGRPFRDLLAVPPPVPPLPHGTEGEVMVRRREGALRPVRYSVVSPEAPGPFLLCLEDLAERHTLAYFDPLTRLPNRALLLDRLHHAIMRAKRECLPVTLIVVNLARFRKVNDSFGHETGDRLLREVGERVCAAVRRADSVARFPGDKFAVLLEKLGDHHAAGVARHIMEALAPPYWVEEQEIFLTFTLGLALYPEDAENPEELLRHAEAAMYQAAEKGGGYRFYDRGMNARVRERFRLESELHRGLERGQFQLRYQPQINPRGGILCGAEALLRWRRSCGELAMPCDFIPLLEETGLIHEVGEWVLREACLQAKGWQDVFPGLCMAVNISAIQISRKDFVPRVERVLLETGFAPGNLVLEVTESVLVQHRSESVEALAALANRGVRIAIDDFGTGYSSLAYLKRFPVQILKIDRQFVADIPRSREDLAIAAAIHSMAEKLGLHVTAEGVENWDQMEILRAWGCSQVQGYLFAPPLSATDFAAWATNRLPHLCGLLP